MLYQRSKSVFRLTVTLGATRLVSIKRGFWKSPKICLLDIQTMLFSLRHLAWLLTTIDKAILHSEVILYFNRRKFQRWYSTSTPQILLWKTSNFKIQIKTKDTNKGKRKCYGSPLQNNIFFLENSHKFTFHWWIGIKMTPNAGAFHKDKIMFCF